MKQPDQSTLKANISNISERFKVLTLYKSLFSGIIKDHLWKLYPFVLQCVNKAAKTTF